MFNKSAHVIASFLLCGAAFAEPDLIGKITQVDGLVTVSDGKTVSSVVLGGLVADDTHYVTSSTGTATLKFDNGCELRLKPRQSVTVHREACELLIASVKSLSDQAALLAIAGDNPLLGFGLVVGTGSLIRSTSNSPISGQ